MTGKGPGVGLQTLGEAGGRGLGCSRHGSLLGARPPATGTCRAGPVLSTVRPGFMLLCIKNSENLFSQNTQTIYISNRDWRDETRSQLRWPICHKDWYAHCSEKPERYELPLQENLHL